MLHLKLAHPHGISEQTKFKKINASANNNNNKAKPHTKPRQKALATQGLREKTDRSHAEPRRHYNSTGGNVTSPSHSQRATKNTTT